MLWLRVDVLDFQQGNGCQCLRGIRCLLAQLQTGSILNHRLNFCLRHSRLLCRQLLCQGSLLPSRQCFIRLHNYRHSKIVFQKIFFQQLLIIISSQLAAQILQIRLVAELLQRVLIIEPVGHQHDIVNQPLRIGTEISLPQLELHEIEGCLQNSPVDAIFHQLGQRVVEHLTELSCLISLCTVYRNGKIWLQHIGLKMGGYIHPQACINQCLSEGCRRCLQESLLQKPDGTNQLMVASLCHHQIVAQEGPAVLRLIFPDRIAIFNLLYLIKGRLQRNGRIHLHNIKIAEIFTVNKSQLLLNIHIAIKINIAVGRRIILFMEINKLLVGQVRDCLGIAPGFTGIGIVREQLPHHLIFQQILRGGQGPLHLIVNHAAVFQRLLRAFNLVMPALLHEDFLIIIDGRIENRIQIHIHQVVKILIVAACHRVHGLIRVGHGIEEGIQ